MNSNEKQYCQSVITIAIIVAMEPYSLVENVLHVLILCSDTLKFTNLKTKINHVMFYHCSSICLNLAQLLLNKTISFFRIGKGVQLLHCGGAWYNFIYHVILGHRCGIYIYTWCLLFSHTRRSNVW